MNFLKRMYVDQSISCHIAEVANGWARYDDKVDIFSLGIVAFELWHPFATGMERAALLRDLQSHGVMPAEWEAAHPQVCHFFLA